MATVVGVDVDGGVVLAGDRLLVDEEGTVRSENERFVFDFGEVGAAAVGDAGGVEEFSRRLESELRTYRTRHDEPMALGRLASVVGDLAEESGVEAVVAARDEDGSAGLRSVDADGRVRTDPTSALGSGAQLALGVLDGRGGDVDFDGGEALAREALEAAAGRDAGTGRPVDVYRLADREPGRDGPE